MNRQTILTTILVITCLSTSFCVAQTDPSLHGGLPFQATRPGQSPMSYSAAMETVFPGRLQITYAAVAGANSYALFSGTEFSLFLQDTAWLTQQKVTSNSNELPPIPSGIPQLDSVVTALEVEGQDPALAMNDELIVKPNGTADENTLPPMPITKNEQKKDKPVVRRHGRLVLNKPILFSGWQKHKKDDKDTKDKAKSDNKSGNAPKNETKDNNAETENDNELPDSLIPPPEVPPTDI